MALEGWGEVDSEAAVVVLEEAGLAVAEWAAVADSRQCVRSRDRRL